MSRNTTGRKWRWFVAYRMDRRADQCWSDLVMWALNWYPKETRPWAPSQPIGSMCRSDLARNGSCYCGKLTAETDTEVSK